MGRTIFVGLFVSGLFAALSVGPVSAQVQRTFVSGLGSDSNPCSRTAPCQTFTQALMGTTAGGEVIVLDSAGYGPFAITQPVSIISPPGVYAGISVFSGVGIAINAGPSDVVILRGLTVNSQGSTSAGISFNTGGTLHVEQCVVNGFTGSLNSAGLAFNNAGVLEVKDSIMRGNFRNITIRPVTGTAVASIDHVRLEDGGRGLDVREGSTVTVRDSVASGNGDGGFNCASITSAAAEMNVESCVASNNLSGGINADSFSTGVATVRVSNCTVTDNEFGLFQGGGALLLSRGNNTVEGNTTNNTVGTIGSYTAK